MTRLLFTALAAIGVLAAFSVWSRAPEPEALPASVVSPETAAPPPLPAPAQPPARSVAPVESVAAPPAREPAPPVLAEPVLEEEDVLEIVERPDFEDGPAAVGPIERDEAGQQDPTDGTDPTDPTAVGDEAPQTQATLDDEPAAPVDIDRSGDLIRRMLALYATMRE